MVRILLLVVFFSAGLGPDSAFCTMIPFATCVVPLAVTVSSLKSLLSHTIVVNTLGIMLRGIVISVPSSSRLSRASAVSCR